MFTSHGINIIMTFTLAVCNTVDIPYLDSTSTDSTNHVSKIFEKKCFVVDLYYVLRSTMIALILDIHKLFFILIS